MFDKSQNYPELTDLNSLNDLMFFTDFTRIYNRLNKNVQDLGQTVLNIFENIKVFEKNIEVFVKI
jgi:hypothetical protein